LEARHSRRSRPVISYTSSPSSSPGTATPPPPPASPAGPAITAALRSIPAAAAAAAAGGGKPAHSRVRDSDARRVREGGEEASAWLTKEGVTASAGRPRRPRRRRLQHRRRLDRRGCYRGRCCRRAATVCARI
jgi:hypothetical protein